MTTPEGETIVGKLSSVNSLEMRLVIDGQEQLHKVRASAKYDYDHENLRL